MCEKEGCQTSFTAFVIFQIWYTVFFVNHEYFGAEFILYVMIGSFDLDNATKDSNLFTGSIMIDTILQTNLILELWVMYNR